MTKIFCPINALLQQVKYVVGHLVFVFATHTSKEIL